MDNSYGLAELHEQLLIIMDDIDRVCRENDIKYTLGDGTLLGAVRENGFIPWDDDMDVRMLREDFERFKVIYEKEMRKEFRIGHPCNPATYSVINPSYEIKGMIKKGDSIINPWVTIFPLDVAPKSVFISNLKDVKMQLLSGMMGKPPQYVNFPDKSKRLWDITDFFGRIIGHDRAKRWFETSCVRDLNKDTGYLSSYTCNQRGCSAHYERDIFTQVQDIAFEDRVYLGLVRAKDFLVLEYGDDYMTPVLPKDRKPKHMIKEQ